MNIHNRFGRAISLMLAAVMLVTCSGISTFAAETMAAEENTAEYTIVEEPAENGSQTAAEEAAEEDAVGEEAAEETAAGATEEEADEFSDGQVADDIGAADPDGEESSAIITDGEATESEILEDDIAEASDSEVWYSEAEKAAAAEEREHTAAELGYVPGEIIIGYDSSCSDEDIQDAAAVYGGVISSVIMETESSDFAVVKISDYLRVDTAISFYEALPIIKSAGKNAVLKFSSYEEDGVNDTYLDEQYYLKSDNGTNCRGANVLKAWDTLTGYVNEGHDLNTVGVTVIDTGCLYTHEDLDGVVNIDKSREIWGTGETEHPIEVHDLLGDNYDYGSQGRCSTPHGTHVTGIIGAAAGNGKGIAGAASVLGEDLDLSVIDAAYYDDEEEDDIFSILTLIQAISLAKVNESKVINMSLAVTAGSAARDVFSILEDAIEAAAADGMIFVCAAGNADTDYFTIPADYDSVISVINTRRDGKRNSTSNYGVSKDISAPGTDIYSTYGTGYEALSGTSMAAPIVSATAALMLSVDPDLTPEEVRTILIDTATDLGDGKYYGAGLVNADAAVKAVIAGLQETTSEATESEATESEAVENETAEDEEQAENGTDADNNSGNIINGGSGRSSGGGGGGGGGQPTVIEGTAQPDPLTGKKKFVSSTGTVYRNTWNTVEMYDAGGAKRTIKIYTDANGDIVTGWQWIRCSDGQIRCFYFSEAQDGTYGQCYVNRTAPGGYTLDGSGYWTVNGAVQISDKETVARTMANDPAEIAAAAAERAKSPSELGYMPGQIIAKVSGTRQQIDSSVAAMGGKVASVLSTENGESTVLINIAANTTVATAQAIYKGNPLFKSVSRNAVLKTQ